MFYLSEIEHTLRLPPHLLNLPLHDAIKGELESLFLDKVISKLGLCVSVYDIKSIDGGFIFPGDGASTYTVRFRLIMFRPFIGEVISAKLKAFDITGLQLSLGFFDDIYVPVHLLPTPSRYEEDEENPKYFRWVWEYDEETKYPIDGLDEIRFRVESINYPPIPVVQELDTQPDDKSEQKKKPFAPMVITGSLLSDGGLGPISWWV